MSKKAIILGAIGGTIAAGAVVAAIAVPIVYVSKTIDKITDIVIPSDTNNITYKNMLTNSKVTDLFNNEWKSKTSISGEDLKPFDAIEFDAFDNIQNKLVSVELLSNIPIVKRNGSFSVDAIHWENVSKILVLEIPDTENNNFISNNVLFSRNGDNVIARTISDRTTNYEVNFSKCQGIENNLLDIAGNFYNINIFKNISRISIGNTKLGTIYDNAFLDCKILEPNLSLEIWDSIYYKAFYNTNIEQLTIYFSETSNWMYDISSFSFSNCHNLRNVNIFANHNGDLKKDLWIANNSFYDSENLTNVRIMCNKLIIEESAFALSENLSNNNDFLLYINTGNLISFPNVVYGKFNKIFDLKIIINNQIKGYGKLTTISPNFLGDDLVIGKNKLKYYSDLYLINPDGGLDINVLGKFIHPI